MLSALRTQVVRQRPQRFAVARRWFATETSMPNAAEETEEQQRARYENFLAQKALEKPTRPQLNIEVDPNHGLFAFFRQVPNDGTFTYETVESKQKPSSRTGRSWNATELRRKSFKDLHTLWYVVLRERNLLATQRAEAKRLGVTDGYLGISDNDRKCRKTMARIKQILNERKLAYEHAFALRHRTYTKAVEVSRIATEARRKVEEEKAERKAQEEQEEAKEAERKKNEVVVQEVAPRERIRDRIRGRITRKRLIEAKTSAENSTSEQSL